MQLIMNDEKLTTIEQIKQFLQGSETLEFKGVSMEERYPWIESVLVRFAYHRLKRAEKGVIRQYLEKVNGATAMIMAWWSQRMAQWYANNWVMAISHRNMPRWLTNFTQIISTPMLTSTGPASLPYR